MYILLYEIVFVAATEEGFFRKILLSELCGAMKTPYAITLGAIIFAVVHLLCYNYQSNSLVKFDTMFLFGVFLGTVFIITKSINVTITIHAGQNLLIYFCREQIVYMYCVGIVLSLIIILCYVVRRKKNVKKVAK